MTSTLTAELRALMPQVQAALPLLTLAAGGAFGLSAALTPPYIRWLKSRQFDKAIRVDGPDHSSKAGTPTMGGIVMVVIVLIVALGLTLVASGSSSDGHRLTTIALAIVAFGTLGVLDDLAGLARRSGGREIGVGLTARRMLSLQILAAVAIALWSWNGVQMRSMAVEVQVAPVLTDPLNALWASGGNAALVVWIAIATVTLVGTVNGVNLSDGLDGLAPGLLTLAFFALGLASMLGSHDLWIWLVSFAAAGACAGFLVFNRHPARVFMGNVGSMGLGGALGAVALVSGTWALLPIIGAVFVAEVLSDIIQIGYFKYSGGKRVFRMAPLHHHFEKGGMPETTVVRRFWLAGALAGAAGLAVAIASIA